MEPTVALVLSGGGVRGLAHLGVVQALEAGGLWNGRVRTLVGTSAGALVAATLATGRSAAEGIRFWTEEIWSRGRPDPREAFDVDWAGILQGLLNWRRFEGFLRGDRLHAFLQRLTAGQLLTHDLYVVTASLATGRPYLWHFPAHWPTPKGPRPTPAPGRQPAFQVHCAQPQTCPIHAAALGSRRYREFPSLADVLRASASLPVYFRPWPLRVVWEEEGQTFCDQALHIDGGVRDNYSLTAAVRDAGHTRVLGVYLGQHGYRTLEPLDGGAYEVLDRTLSMMLRTLFEAEQESRDLGHVRIWTLLPALPSGSLLALRALDTYLEAGQAAGEAFLGLLEAFWGDALDWDRIFTPLPAAAKGLSWVQRTSGDEGFHYLLDLASELPPQRRRCAPLRTRLPWIDRRQAALLGGILGGAFALGVLVGRWLG